MYFYWSMILNVRLLLVLEYFYTAVLLYSHQYMMGVVDLLKCTNMAICLSPGSHRWATRHWCASRPLGPAAGWGRPWCCPACCPSPTAGASWSRALTTAGTRACSWWPRCTRWRPDPSPPPPETDGRETRVEARKSLIQKPTGLWSTGTYPSLSL